MARFALPSGKAPYRVVRTGPPTNRYADHPPTRRYRLNRSSAINFDRRWRRGEKYLVHCSSPVPSRGLSSVGDSFSPRGEKDRGDRYTLCLSLDTGYRTIPR
ncbi:hypothetical protein BHE74_00023913 [Ensete ventricosum]|nr:hypothetical protein GW17_00053835 [Ensete ventricosum]RWW68553.1 hypothetical protein BHE74_00023913 [Ensete ventricosum]RZR99327.1 hypothetical protein BHM03_00028842 [Ensete ventricosum]